MPCKGYKIPKTYDSKKISFDEDKDLDKVAKDIKKTNMKGYKPS